ncbi:MAG TPA: AAA family ATPase [Acidimicrobiales bacterium]|nr:AAA family ATPase [Acidimicrobiales bacterium]
MKFSRLHVDGFGSFASRDIGPLGDGLNIVLGENETGKSTLLDFVRGVLYGFTDRRSPKNFHEPLYGGKHGGSIDIRDEQGSTWTVRRYVGQSVTITERSGAQASQSTLSSLLGHTDKKVFESIFAFGLDELAEAGRLHDESVRDLIFSAGVAGAGRSASQAIRRLEDERSEITKNSRAHHQKNPLALLIIERDELADQLRLARRESTSYANLQREIDRLDRMSESLFTRISDREHRRTELDRLADAEKSRQRRLELESQLALAGDPSHSQMLLSARRLQIVELAARAEGFHREVAEYDRLSRAIAEQEENIRILRDRIGLKADQPTPRAITIGLQSEIEDLGRDYQNIQLELRDEQANISRVKETLDRQRLAVARLTKGHDPSEFDEVTNHLRELSILRAMLGKRRELVLSGQLAEKALASRERARTGLDHAIMLILGLVALLGLVGFIFRLTKPAHGSTLVAILGAIAFLAGTIGLLLLSRQSQHQRASPQQADNAHEADSSEELLERISERAHQLGLASQPTEAELEELETQLRTREEVAAEIRITLLSEQQCRVELDEATRAVKHCQEQVSALQTRADSYGDEIGLAQHVNPEILIKVVGAIADLVEQEVRHQRDLELLPALRLHIDAYEDDLRSQYREIEREVPDRAAYAKVLSELAAEADLAQREIAAREAIIAEIDRIDEILTSLVNRNSDSSALRDELESSSIAERELELAALERETDEIKSEIQQILGQRHDRQNEIESLNSSSSIADLEIRIETIQIEIRAILDRWVLLALSSAILKEALNRYEIERQPAVIERAGRLFAEVTAGRYTKLSSHEDEQQRRSLWVIQRDGKSFEAHHLSKGTAEQLYLCVRLAYAMTFADRAVAMPLIFDDVLVNFDPKRCEQVARAIATVAERHQVILFTCHPNIAETLVGASPQASTITLDHLSPRPT